MGAMQPRTGRRPWHDSHVGSEWGEDDDLGIAPPSSAQRTIGRALYGGRALPLLGVVLVVAGVLGIVVAVVDYVIILTSFDCPAGCAYFHAVATTGDLVVPVLVAAIVIAIGATLLRFHNRDWPPRTARNGTSGPST